MTVDKPIFHYLRLVLEALTPHAIQSGRGDITHDLLLVRDANGLPAIPATSLAGALRHLYRAEYGPQHTDALFGFAAGDGGQASAVGFTWCLVHDSNNRAVEGIHQAPDGDSLLIWLLQDKPLVRQRVRLNARGAAEDSGKFDTTLVPAGTRYTGFISYWSDGSAEQEQALERLVGLLHSPILRLGHGTRSGQGSFKVAELQGARWDLTTQAGREAFCQRPRKRADSGQLKPVSQVSMKQQPLYCRLRLQAEGGWRVGGGELSFHEQDTPGATPDLLPQAETLIRWSDSGKASLVPQVAVVPASAIKGALAHRVAFHYRRLNGDYVDTAGLAPHTDCPAVKQLFGDAAEDGDGSAGKLVINDIYLEQPHYARQMHNRIDHYSGGVMDGALFEEEVFWRTPLEIEIIITKPDNIDSDSRAALVATLEDLANGWLPLGAGGARGLGCFTGSMCWSDIAWMEGAVA